MEINIKEKIMDEWQNEWQDVLAQWKIDFDNLITRIDNREWETVSAEEVKQLLNDEELFLLRINGLHFNLPQGIGDAYDLRSQVQAKMADKTWVLVESLSYS